MRGAPVESQKINRGAMVLIREVSFLQKYFRQKKPKRLLSVCASKQRIHLIVMAHI
jgi:hypothetical protein